MHRRHEVDRLPLGPVIERGRQAEDAALRMADEVRASLASTTPWIDSKFFYDDRGSELFEQITRLPEYYPTRTEESLLERIADEVIERTGAHELIELGSGAGRKIRLLLDAMQRRGGVRRVTMLDINETVLASSLQELGAAYPTLGLRGVVGDFMHHLELVGPGEDRLFIFLAGTIGNLHPAEVPAFLAMVRRELGPGDAFLVGVDLVKDVARLEAAYNDAAGVTAEFNRNLLSVLNARLGSDFDPKAFEHVAFWVAERSWIEMRLRATRTMRVDLGRAGLVMELARGDEIRTEISCKYTRESWQARLEGTGLTLEHWFTDPEQLFALALLVPDAGSRRRP